MTRHGRTARKDSLGDVVTRLTVHGSLSRPRCFCLAPLPRVLPPGALTIPADISIVLGTHQLFCGNSALCPAL